MPCVNRPGSEREATPGRQGSGNVAVRESSAYSAVTLAPTLRTAVTATAALLVARFLFHPGVFASGHRKVLIRPGARAMDHVHVHRE